MKHMVKPNNAILIKNQIIALIKNINDWGLNFTYFDKWHKIINIDNNAIVH
jgi:hypothetical protein